MWYLPFSENIKKRACRYLLQRYLGDYLKEKLTLEQLSIDLYNGTGTVSDVSLDCEALNEVGDKQNWPLEIVDGYMNEITVTVPWSTLLKDHCVVQVSGLSVTVQPKERAEPVSSMLESMWSSMSSSMQLAAECLGEEEQPQEAQSVDGIEMFAHAIDSILSRVKVKFVDTKIRIEHVPKNGDRGIALEIHIENINYFDEAGSEPKPEDTDPDKSKTYIEATCTNKKIQCRGVTLYTDEYPSKLRTMARSLIMSNVTTSQQEPSHMEDVNFKSASSDMFYETTSVISTIENDPTVDVLGETNSKTVRDPLPEDKSSQPKPVLFGKLNGDQELSLKLKHTDEVDTPKIEVNILFGSFVIFISPRQLHTMIELADALSQPHLEDTSNVPLRSGGVKMQCKPMKQADFQLIEAQLLGNFQQETVRTAKSGWSGPSFDLDNEKFHPMTSENLMTESFNSSLSSMNTSMTSSITIPSSLPRLRQNRKALRVDGDPTADVTHISLKVASVTCVLIHRDIIMPKMQGLNQLLPSTVDKMQQTSMEFFDNLARCPMDGAVRTEYSVAINDIENSTDRNHLRLMAADILINASEKVTSHGSQTTCEASLRHVLAQECLYSKNNDAIGKPKSYDVLRFETKEDTDEHASVLRPNIKINFKQSAKYIRLAGEKKTDHPETDIVVKCTPAHMEIDLTLMERMSATFFGGTNSQAEPTPQQNTHNQFNFSLQCSDLKATLRFPIADLRARDPRVNDFRSIRSDYLVFAFHNATVSSRKAASVRPQPTTIGLKCTTLDLYYHENDDLPATHIARTTMDTNCDCDLRCSNPILPSISLTFRASSMNKSPFDTISDDHFAPVGNPMTTSMYVLNNLSSSEPSPFSGKKMAHQSVIKARENDSKEAKEEELIIPGTEEEMTEFTNSITGLSEIHLEFSLPILSLQLESKQLYEIIYNRINSDLLLWEPNIIDETDINPDVCGDIYPFDMFKGGYDSDSGSSTSEEDYFTSARRETPINTSVTLDKKETHAFCLTFKVNKGLLTIYAPVRDSNKLVVPGQMGELVLEAHKLSLCHVSGINGIAKTGKMCLRATTTTLYHEAMLSIPSEKPCLRIFGTRLPPHLKKTIYPSNNEVILKDVQQKKDMFSLALKVHPDPDASNLKTLCTALGLERATLRYRGEKGITWLTQLLDVLDVLDYPVPGYTPSTVVSELHVHLWDCAVDYRPLYLPIRTVVTLGNFNISNNVIPATNTSCLKFLAQDCCLFLSYIHGTKNNLSVPQDDEKMPNVHKDYVCVIDIGLFELLLRMEDKANQSKSHPQVELSASNNMVNLYTCWDSATALCHLVTYISSEGDSQPPYDRSSRHTSICSDPPLEPLVGLDDRPEEIRELSQNEVEQMNAIISDALEESPNTTLEEDELNSSMEKEKIEVFFFPDESNMKRKTSIDSTTEGEIKMEEEISTDITNKETKLVHPQVAKELGVPTTPKSTKKVKRKKKTSGEGSNTDDEYCIVDTQPYKEELDLDEPVVNWFNNGPIFIYDNHFTIPAARTDVLKAPKNFPDPVLRYTLFEMSVTWNLFGGNDFKPGHEASPPKKSVTIEDARKQGSPTSVKRGVEYEPYASGSSPRVRWSSGAGGVGGALPSPRPAARPAPPPHELKLRGGPARDHRVCVKLCLTKVKFQHEVYPSSGVHASRQTLAISKIEVLDRLFCSDINKLLSLYMKDEPDRKNAHMLIIKAVHLRSDPALSTQECCLKISLLPLRFNLDQDTLAFIIGFFSKLGSEDGTDDDSKSLSGLSTESSGSQKTTPTHRPPVMGIASHLRDPPPTPTSLGDADSLSLNESVNREEGPIMEPYEAERLVSENLIQLEEDFNRLGVSEDKPPARSSIDSEPVDDSPIYFRRVVFSPDVPIRLDYVGKRVELSCGPVAGLLMGLGQLDCSELTLKRLDHKQGILGLEKLVQWALHEWLTDIKRHQLPGLLSGIGPLHSLLQLITGIRDLLWMPVEQWRRDGRVVHGLRRGAASFSARTAVAALDITTRLLHLIQATAETAFDMLTPGPTLQLAGVYERRARRRRRTVPSRQPADLRAGVATAYNTVREGIAETAATMALVARCESGVGVLRHLPGAVVSPLALAAAGAADVLGGVRAHLAAPRARHDYEDKWRQPQRPHQPTAHTYASTPTDFFYNTCDKID